MTELLAAFAVGFLPALASVRRLKSWDDSRRWLARAARADDSQLPLPIEAVEAREAGGPPGWPRYFRGPRPKRVAEAAFLKQRKDLEGSRK